MSRRLFWDIVRLLVVAAALACLVLTWARNGA